MHLTFLGRQGLANDTSSSIISEKIGSVKLIAINRSHKKNAIDSLSAKQLHSAVVDFEEDPECKVAVLYGKGNKPYLAYFCFANGIPMTNNIRIELELALVALMWISTMYD